MNLKKYRVPTAAEIVAHVAEQSELAAESAKDLELACEQLDAETATLNSRGPAGDASRAGAKAQAVFFAGARRELDKLAAQISAGLVQVREAEAKLLKGLSLAQRLGTCIALSRVADALGCNNDLLAADTVKAREALLENLGTAADASVSWPAAVAILQTRAAAEAAQIVAELHLEPVAAVVALFVQWKQLYPAEYAQCYGSDGAVEALQLHARLDLLPIVPFAPGAAAAMAGLSAVRALKDPSATDFAAGVWRKVAAPCLRRRLADGLVPLEPAAVHTVSQVLAAIPEDVRDAVARVGPKAPVWSALAASLHALASFFDSPRGTLAAGAREICSLHVNALGQTMALLEGAEEHARDQSELTVSHLLRRAAQLPESL